MAEGAEALRKSSEVDTEEECCDSLYRWGKCNIKTLISTVVAKRKSNPTQLMYLKRKQTNKQTNKRILRHRGRVL